MKRILLFFAAVLALTGCAKDKSQNGLKDVESRKAETVKVSLCAKMVNDAETKATIDEDGTGANADQCKLQIWWGDVIYFEKVVPVTDYEASFEDIVLMRDQTYDFLFWADNAAGDYYVTDTLTAVKLKNDYVGCDDKRDAFFKAETWKVTEAFSKTVELRRPFAQLNVITKDVSSIYNQIPDKSDFNKVVPEKVALTVTAPSVFNVKTGDASEDLEFTYEAKVYTSPYKTSPDGVYNTLSMDYFYAPAAEGHLVDVKFTAKNATSGLVDIDYYWTNVPLRRNWRTNIIGNLFTRTGTIDVIIVPIWDGEYDY